MNYIISVPLDVSIAEFLGKKGTEGSLTFYNKIIDKNAIVILFPTNIENMISVAESMLLSDIIIISTSNIDKFFGEVIIAAALTKKHIIFTDDNNIEKYIKDIEIKDFEFASKTELINCILKYNYPISATDNNMKDNYSRVDLDRAFTVKGIGNVALGIITKGVINLHDELYCNSGKKVLIKSIQTHDINIESAIPKMRVGLALKGINADEISKGDILLSKQFNKLSTVTAKININILEADNKKILQGEQYILVSNFMHAIVTINNFNKLEKIIEISLNNPSYFEKGDIFFLLQNRTPRIFAFCEVI
ncbi:MAG: EF-Tu/IF-2/RF-3 family GTPase [Candidatus Marsarchaeota archaeon]|jgi:selenocysteine-specific translation elongation factor|nr:EF-Tu/IF-2/RF-3 family GTPase [Candidatus Marsarchaeota archaeon]